MEFSAWSAPVDDNKSSLVEMASLKNKGTRPQTLQTGPVTMGAYTTLPAAVVTIAMLQLLRV
ncbi:14925_t:CDS:2 [Dentiscutata erythropus]|uniref:14925_t:CDS:1 n=1 Tax=Dentiscutata erythropus TaxID=1348616 RepID=A0A9N9E9B8_9GLOM|nr:14925_t:CDS:2 [Dentiscutata erythropus]